MSKAKTTSGMFTENCIVLAEGYLQDQVRFSKITFIIISRRPRNLQVFHVQVLGMPLCERREETLKHVVGMDFTGRPTQTNRSLLTSALGLSPASHLAKQLKRREQQDDMMMVVLSDVWLDVEGVFSALADMLRGFIEATLIPSVIVLMGNFTSKPLGSSTAVRAIGG